MSAMVLKRFLGLVAALFLTAVPFMAWPIFEDFDNPLEPGVWTFMGNASHDEEAGHLEVVPAANDQTGAAWLNETVDCTTFYASFKLYIGDGSGADGLVFAWVREQGMGGGGGALGWYDGGFSGYGLVFDTYPQPTMNQVSFEDPEVHTGSDTGGFVAYEPPIDLENTGWFDVEIMMDNGHLQVWMSNEAGGFPRPYDPVIDYSLADYTGFGAYFGFTAATGGASNNHWIDDFAISPELAPLKYQWLGFLQPLTIEDKAFKQKSTIPVKFRITDLDGNPVSDCAATIAIYYLESSVPADEPEVVSTAAGDWGDQFRYDPEDDLYIFNLSTKPDGYYPGWTYEILVTLDDGQEFTTTFALK